MYPSHVTISLSWVGSPVRKSRGTARKNALEFSQSFFSGSSSIYHQSPNVANKPALRQFSRSVQYCKKCRLLYLQTGGRRELGCWHSVDATGSPIHLLDARQEGFTRRSRQQGNISRGPVKKLIQLLVLQSHLACTRPVEVVYRDSRLTAGGQTGTSHAGTLRVEYSVGAGGVEARDNRCVLPHWKAIHTHLKFCQAMNVCCRTTFRENKNGGMMHP